jgi:protein-disulfide isomerase
MSRFSRFAPVQLQRRDVLTGLASMLIAASAGVSPARAQAPEAMRIPVELAQEAEALASAVVLGNPRGDVTMVEFFDYNCGYCKVSARELDAFLKSDREVKYVLVNLAVLGLASVLAHKVALGFLNMQGPKRYADLHRRLFALSGPVDGDRALREAERLGANKAKLTDAANDPRIAAMLKQSVDLADNLGLVATPSLLVGSEAYQGYVSLAQKKAIAARVRA